MSGPAWRDLPPAAFALALASLPGAGPVSLRAALEGRTPQQAWIAVCEGVIVRPPRRAAPASTGGDQLAFGGAVAATSAGATSSWGAFATRWDSQAAWRDSVGRGIGVTWLGDDHYPARLSADPEAPPILFWRGDLGCLASPTVAVVGTRHCTPTGRAVAKTLGQELAEAGVCVVSGLALGIDGAAHRGALSASHSAGATAGVAASGVDVAYPRQHQELWQQVVTDGVVIAETAPGRPAQAWRFPARNRIIAALADMVVVVESFEAGGSLLTVDAALARGVEVRAVPGSVHSPASLGTNRLLVDGAAPVRHTGDVLDALGVDRPGGVLGLGPPDVGRPGRANGAAVLDCEERQVLEAVGWAPTLLARVVERSGSTVAVAVRSLARLEDAGLVIAGDSWWVRTPER